MVPVFQHEAEKIIELLPNEFTTHQFLTFYAMGYPLSYLDLMEEYGNVRLAHNQVSNELRRLSDSNLLPIVRNGKTMDPSIFGKEDSVAIWNKR